VNQVYCKSLRQQICQNISVSLFRIVWGWWCNLGDQWDLDTSFLFFVYDSAAVGKHWLFWSVAIRRAKEQVILLI